ncbi:uncharacterized protein LOC143447131 isoform X2 [Clavelina lepadiformis]|uniref:uncharacterized protein LOC143447131 isoform X2 n=1 Tax=Clavelina lepadiformis TaxID=159417 RepID=UPI00404288C9
MTKKRGYKTWAQARNDIEETLKSGRYAGNDSELCFESGLQLAHTLSHYPSPIFSSSFYEDQKEGFEYYLLNYVSADSGESFIVQWRYDPTAGSAKITKKSPIRQYLNHILWIHTQNAFIGYCDDMTIRGYNGVTFEEKYRFPLDQSVLSIIYLDDFDELVTGGRGSIVSWKIRIIDFGIPIEMKEPLLKCDVAETMEWVRQLSYDKKSKNLFVLTDDTIYVVSMSVRRQIGMIDNTHKASLTSCTFYKPFSYLITAARDGSIHVYNTAVRALAHKFSPHRDGVTGVLSITNHPILISWSQMSGCLRMWRLDTLQLANETALSENINYLQVVHGDRLFYLTESEVRIFDLNSLYNIFATLSSFAETFRFCCIRRTRLPAVEAVDEEATNSRRISFADKVEDESPTPSAGSNKLQTVNILAQMNNSSVPHFADRTFVDRRLICVLDDRCIIAVSPTSGMVLNIIYPSAELDKPPVGLDIESTRKGCYVVLSDGVLVEYDCSVNPGQIANIHNTGKGRIKICSVVAMEIYLGDEGFVTGQRQQGIFIGMENGFIKLYDGGESQEDNVSVPYARREGRRQTTQRRKSSINAIGPFLTMQDKKAHSGEVSLQYVPFEGTFSVDESNKIIPNILISIGSDKMTIIWGVSLTSTSSPFRLEVLLQKLRAFRCERQPTCFAAAANLLFYGFMTGNIDMVKMTWKSIRSAQEALIKVDNSSVIVTAMKSIAIDREIQHKAEVTSVGESHLLSLFVSSSADMSIKIWDSCGLLVRELLLGYVIPSVCFANGRDLLASLSNYIVKVEAHHYLPTDYLRKILDNVDDGSFEVEPETPIPMDGPLENMFFVTHAQEEDRKESFDISKIPSSTTQPDDLEELELMRSYSKRKNKRRPTICSLFVPDKEEEVSEVESVVWKDDSKVMRRADKAEKFVSGLDPNKMAKYPVAPDGFIPNSVIRDRVQTVYPPPNFFDQFSLGGCNDKNFQDMDEDDLSWDEVRIVDCDTTPEDEWSDMEDYEYREDGTVWKRVKEERELELKRYLKGRREEGRLELVIKEKQGNPREKKRKSFHLKAKEQLKEIRKQRKAQKEIEEVEKDELELLVDELNQMHWCPDIITTQDLEQGLLAVAEELQHAGSNVSSEICRYISLIHDACKKKDIDQNSVKLFSANLEKVFAYLMKPLLSHGFASLQKAAAECLSKFDDSLLKDVVMDVLMPGFLHPADDVDGGVFHTDETILTAAAHRVKIFSTFIDEDRLLLISRALNINSYRGSKAGEQDATDKMRGLLVDAGIPILDIPIWAGFIIPLLPDKVLEKKDLPVDEPKAKVEMEKSQGKRHKKKSANLSKSKRRKSPDKTLPNQIISSATKLRDDVKVSFVDTADEEKLQYDSKNDDFSSSAWLQHPGARSSKQSRELQILGSTVGSQQAADENLYPDLIDDFRKLSMIGEIPLRPVSMTDTINQLKAKNSSLPGLRANPVKSSEEMRRESLQVLKVMQRSSLITITPSQPSLNTAKHKVQHFGTPTRENIPEPPSPMKAARSMRSDVSLRRKALSSSSEATRSRRDSSSYFSSWETKGGSPDQSEVVTPNVTECSQTSGSSSERLSSLLSSTTLPSSTDEEIVSSETFPPNPVMISVSITRKKPVDVPSSAESVLVDEASVSSSTSLSGSESKQSLTPVKSVSLCRVSDKLDETSTSVSTPSKASSASRRHSMTSLPSAVPLHGNDVRVSTITSNESEATRSRRDSSSYFSSWETKGGSPDQSEVVTPNVTECSQTSGSSSERLSSLLSSTTLPSSTDEEIVSSETFPPNPVMISVSITRKKPVDVPSSAESVLVDEASVSSSTSLSGSESKQSLTPVKSVSLCRVSDKLDETSTSVSTPSKASSASRRHSMTSLPSAVPLHGNDVRVSTITSNESQNPETKASSASRRHSMTSLPSAAPLPGNDVRVSTITSNESLLFHDESSGTSSPTPQALHSRQSTSMSHSLFDDSASREKTNADVRITSSSLPAPPPLIHTNSFSTAYPAHSDITEGSERRMSTSVSLPSEKMTQQRLTSRAQKQVATLRKGKQDRGDCDAPMTQEWRGIIEHLRSRRMTRIDSSRRRVIRNYDVNISKHVTRAYHVMWGEAHLREPLHVNKVELRRQMARRLNQSESSSKVESRDPLTLKRKKRFDNDVIYAWEPFVTSHTIDKLPCIL